jgi:hypothetical protein
MPVMDDMMPCTGLTTMAWETRGRNGRRYYYSARWSDGRTVKNYFGRGAPAELAAGLDADARRLRAAEGEALQAERSRLEPAERAMRALDAACELLLDETLTAAGYHRQNYSAWRRRRARPDATI